MFAERLQMYFLFYNAIINVALDRLQLISVTLFFLFEYWFRTAVASVASFGGAAEYAISFKDISGSSCASFSRWLEIQAPWNIFLVSVNSPFRQMPILLCWMPWFDLPWRILLQLSHRIFSLIKYHLLGFTICTREVHALTQIPFHFETITITKLSLLSYRLEQFTRCLRLPYIVTLLNGFKLLSLALCIGNIIIKQLLFDLICLCIEQLEFIFKMFLMLQILMHHWLLLLLFLIGLL